MNRDELISIISNHSNGLFPSKFCDSLADKIINRIDNKKTGFVYVIRNNYNGYYKIGYTLDTKQRFSQFRNVLDKFDTICIIETEEFKELEKHLHFKFSKHNVFGEWFDLPDYKLSFFDKFKMNSSYDSYNSKIKMSEIIEKDNDNITNTKLVYKNNPDFDKKELSIYLGCSVRTIQRNVNKIEKTENDI